MVAASNERVAHCMIASANRLLKCVRVCVHVFVRLKLTFAPKCFDGWSDSKKAQNKCRLFAVYNEFHLQLSLPAGMKHFQENEDFLEIHYGLNGFINFCICLLICGKQKVD